MENVKCNLCNADKTKRLFAIGDCKIVKCKQCSLIYTNPRLNKEESAKIYRIGYYNNPGFFKGKSYFGYKNYLMEKKDITDTFMRRLEVIEKYAAKGRILDIGCALGFFLELAKSRRWDVYGTEISDSACSYITKNSKIKVFHGDLEEANFKNEFFDVVTMFDVIEHLGNPRKYLKECNRILKKGGILAIGTPNSGSILARMLGKHWLEYKRVKEHNYFFSHRTLRKMLEQEGFQILGIRSAGKFFSLSSIAQEAKIYNKTFFKFIHKCMERTKLGNMRVYIDPKYKMTVYARKVV